MQGAHMQAAHMQAVQRYPAGLQAIHWVTVALILIIYGLTYTEDFFARGTPARAAVWWLHISFGLVLIAAVAARIIARALGEVPPPSASVSPVMHRASQAVHALLYLLLIVTPLVGIYLSFLRGNDVTLFGLFTIPDPLVVDKVAARPVQEIHEWLANAIIVVALLHAAAALWHHFVRKDDVLARMLPGGRR